MQENRIPLARSVRWRRVRAQMVPVLSFSLAVVASGWIWQHHGAAVQGIGEVDSPRVDLASPTAGLVVSLPNQNRGQWLIYDHVRAGDVIAQIEDQQLVVSKSLLREEVKRLVDQLQFVKPADNADEAIRTAWENEHSQLLSLDERASASAQDTLAGNLDPISTAAEVAATIATASDDALGRLRTARLALDQRSEELQRRRQMLEIQSPISGTLVAVHCWPGQTVPLGGLIATIVADHGQHIVGYVPEQSSFVPRPGTPVALRTRVVGSSPIMSEIEQVGRQIEQIPRHQRSISTIPQWGIPVRIKMPADTPLRPGSLLDLSFYGADAS